MIKTTVKGSYVLLLSLAAEADIEIGRLGRFRCPPGYYLYCGSALGGLDARIARHRRPEKKLHWHIDYFRKWADLVGVWTFASKASLECKLASLLIRSGLASVPIKRFGSSDCRCSSHLLVLAGLDGSPASFTRIVRAVDDIFRDAALPIAWECMLR